jgi:lysophospholipase L1-like esterase
MQRRLLFALTAAALVAIATLILSEVVVRVAKRFVCYQQIASVYERSPVYGWGHEAGRASWQQGCIGRDVEYRAHVRINDLGLRGPDYPYEKPAGTERVLVLGDSIVEATQVAEEETFVRQLEQLLHAPDRPVEVLNGGTAGWGTDNELLFFTAEGRRYDPDLVVLIFNLSNDVSDNHAELYRRSHEEGGHEVLGKAYAKLNDAGRPLFDFHRLAEYLADESRKDEKRERSLWFRLTKTFYLLRLVDRRLDPAPAPRPLAGLPTTMQVHFVPPGEEWQQAWRTTEALLIELTRAVERAGARLGIAVLPARETVMHQGSEGAPRVVAGGAQRWDWDFPRTRIAELLDGHELHYGDLTEWLREHYRATGRTGFFAFDPHLTPEGHRLVAEAIREQLIPRVALNPTER